MEPLCSSYTKMWTSHLHKCKQISTICSKSQTLNRISSPKSQNHLRRNDKFLHISTTYTYRHHQRQISIHASATQQNDAHFVSLKSHFAKPEHEWAKRQVVASGRSATVAVEVGGWERERAPRKKKKKSDLRFLNPNEPFGLGSIFNRGKKQFLAAVQFHLRQKIVFGIGFLMNLGIKVGKNCKTATAPFYVSVKR